MDRTLRYPLETSRLISIATSGYPVVVGALCAFDPLYALIAGAAILAPLAIGKLIQNGPQVIFYASLFAMIILEGDYADYDAIVVKIAAPFFTQAYIPVVSPFEITGILLLIWTYVKCTSIPRSFPRKAFWIFASCTAAHFFIACLMMIYGLAQGGKLQVAFWQMKSFAVFPVWALVAFLVVRTPMEAKKLLSTILAAGMIKTLYNAEVFFVGLGGSKGTQEYFTSHMGSLLMAVPMLIAAIRLKLTRVPRITTFVYVIYIIATTHLWIENDRRASLMGTMLSIIFALFAAIPFFKPKTVKKFLFILTSLVAVTSLTWELPPPTPGGILKNIMTHGGAMAEDIIDYRDIENYNLFTTISNHPFGRGYGFPFEQHMELPDIFSIAELLLWVPHNSLLMIWAFGGPQNIAAFGLLFVMSMAVAVRLFQRSPSILERILGLITMMTMVQWLIYVWADMAWMSIAPIAFPASLAGASAGLLARREKRQAYKVSQTTRLPQAS